MLGSRFHPRGRDHPCPKVSLEPPHGGQRAVQALAGHIMFDVAVSLRPRQDRADKLTEPPRDLRFAGPYRRDDPQDIFPRDGVHGPVPEGGQRAL